MIKFLVPVINATNNNLILNFGKKSKTRDLWLGISNKLKWVLQISSHESCVFFWLINEVDANNFLDNTLREQNDQMHRFYYLNNFF